MKFGASRKAIVIALIIVIPIAAALVKTLSFGAAGRICKGVTISNVSVSGFSRSRAERVMRAWAAKRADRRITLTALDSRWVGSVADFGAHIKWKESVDQAMAVGRKGNIIGRMICVLNPTSTGKAIDVQVALDHNEIEKTIAKVARSVNRPHKDAKIKVVSGRLEVDQDSVGIKLDEDRAAKVISNALRTDAMVVTLPVISDKPDVTAEDARGIDTLLARFTTPFNPGKVDRTHNLTLAARSINGIILKPGEEFSYNDAVGPRVLGRGFRNAPIFVKGKLEPGVGGGICQVSTTLYNTVLLAGLHIIERHPHSRTVPYVGAGRDATVAYGLRDFRFTNSNASPICILTSISRGNVAVDLYGASQEKKDVKIYTGPVRYSPPKPAETVTDATLASGVHKVIDKGARGVRVTVYRKISQPDGADLTEVVSNDRYPPQAKIIAVGPTQAGTNMTQAKPVGVANDVSVSKQTESNL
ncbi:VanW family protein [bacterium]|nr:VanW family protein [bacterium]